MENGPGTRDESRFAAAGGVSGKYEAPPYHVVGRAALPRSPKCSAVERSGGSARPELREARSV